jgi:hypothetical protein
VLQDEFISSVTRAKTAEEQIRREKDDKRKLRGVLDSLTTQLITFEDNDDLELKINAIYHKLDEDGSGGLDFKEFKFGVKEMAMNIHLTRDDFDIITENGKHLNRNAEFGREQFQDMMRGELWRFSRRELSNVLSLSESRDFAGTVLMLKLFENNVVHIMNQMMSKFDNLQCVICGSGCAVQASEKLPGSVGGGQELKSPLASEGKTSGILRDTSSLATFSSRSDSAQDIKPQAAVGSAASDNALLKLLQQMEQLGQQVSGMQTRSELRFDLLQQSMQSQLQAQAQQMQAQAEQMQIMRKACALLLNKRCSASPSDGESLEGHRDEGVSGLSGALDRGKWSFNVHTAANLNAEVVYATPSDSDSISVLAGSSTQCFAAALRTGAGLPRQSSKQDHQLVRRTRSQSSRRCDPPLMPTDERRSASPTYGESHEGHQDERVSGLSGALERSRQRTLAKERLEVTQKNILLMEGRLRGLMPSRT